MSAGFRRSDDFVWSPPQWLESSRIRVLARLTAQLAERTTQGQPRRSWRGLHTCAAAVKQGCFVGGAIGHQELCRRSNTQSTTFLSQRRFIFCRSDNSVLSQRYFFSHSRNPFGYDPSHWLAAMISLRIPLRHCLQGLPGINSVSATREPLKFGDVQSWNPSCCVPCRLLLTRMGLSRCVMSGARRGRGAGVLTFTASTFAIET